MKRLAQRATKKKKSGVGKLSSLKVKNLVSPIYLTVPGSKNVTDPCGELQIRNLQFPTTIYHHMRQAQVEKLKLFVEGMKTFSGDVEGMIRLLNRAPKLHSCESYGGCTRWAYDAVFFSDGQDRYEPSDDVSFDILGTFCPSCELSRRLVESKPIHYEVPEENEILTPSRAGFTDENWVWAHDPVSDYCRVDRSIEGKCFWNLSVEKFRSLLVMICTVLEVKEVSKVIGAYRCGHRRVYVAETLNNIDVGNMDFQKDLLDRLESLEEPRYYEEAMFRICLSEFNPFIGSELGGDQVFYSPSLTINILSEAIYGLSVKMHIGNTEHVFQTSYSGSFIPSFTDLRSMLTFPDDFEFYPGFYAGLSGYSPIIIYSLFYLNEDKPGEFNRIVREDPQHFLKILETRLPPQDAREFISRLIEYKRNSQRTKFFDSLVGVRKCIGGLCIKK